MKYIIYLIFNIMIILQAFAADNIIVPKNSGVAFIKDNGGNLLPMSISYSTDGSGNLKLINSSNPIDDSITVPPLSGKMYLNGADGKLYPAMVLYTTDGNGNPIPIPIPSPIPAPQLSPKLPSDYIGFVDNGIVFAPSGTNAYYPSVLFDSSSFGTNGGPKFKMWYGDGSTNIFQTTSIDGTTWTTRVGTTGLSSDGYHNQIIYDMHCFNVSPCNGSAIKYKIYYWRSTQNLYSTTAFYYAESSDGLAWINNQAITQDSILKIITGVAGYNYGSYGPIQIFYQSVAKNLGTAPFDYSYVMYYDCTTGSKEQTCLGYSIDGKNWFAYGSAPVLTAASGWDLNYATFGTIRKDASGFHYWYSGGIGGSNQGIGYAYSNDGINWIKYASNPLFTITGAPSYRNSRTYTPSIVDNGNGTIFMFYSALSTSGGSFKQIGKATLIY